MTTETATKTKWSIDKSHSEIQFKAKHLMITNVTGSFADYDAHAEFDENDFASAHITFTAKTASVTTGNEQRDTHLRSDDFFASEKFPTLSFASTSIQKRGNEFTVTGNLTIKEVTKTVMLNVEYNGVATDPWGNKKTGFTITGKINRKDWGLNWNAALEAGGMLVSEEIKINCSVQMVKSA